MSNSAFPTSGDQITPAVQSVSVGRPSLKVNSFGLSDPGRERTNNEDCFVIAEFVRNLNIQHTNIPQPPSMFGSHPGYVFLVADGVGGNNAGQIASALSVMTIEHFLLNAFRRLTSLHPSEEQSALHDLHEALFQADARLFKESEKHPEWHGMGTTLTMALAVNRRLFVAHAGDSRCYLFSRGQLRQLTQDHTMSAEMERTGLISAKIAANHPWRHVLSNLLGGSKPGVQVELHSLELHDEDVLLICSDGLTEMLSDDAIGAILGSQSEPRQACTSLVSEANRLGGRDNITVIVARFSDVTTDKPTKGSHEVRSQHG